MPPYLVAHARTYPKSGADAGLVKNRPPGNLALLMSRIAQGTVFIGQQCFHVVNRPAEQGNHALFVSFASGWLSPREYGLGILTLSTL